MSADGVAEGPSSAARPQSLAETALTYLAALDDTHLPEGAGLNAPAIPPAHGNAVHDNCSFISALPPSQPHIVVPSELTNIDPSLNNAQTSSPALPLGQHTIIVPSALEDIDPGLEHARTTFSSPTPGSQHPLPSFLRYVDNDLMLNVADFDNPMDPDATCTICHLPWDTPPINYTQASMSDIKPMRTTFLPLSPCRHWVHYRCFIALATKNSPQRDKCAECGTQLFQWEGITVLTLATRTGLLMENNDPKFIATHAKHYEVDCVTIVQTIHEQFFAHLALESPHADGSPDLVQCFNNTLDVLRYQNLPKAKWLKYETNMGQYLWAALVAIKMRRYMMEQHAKIVITEAWDKFEQGWTTLSQRIMKEVRD